MSITNVNNSPLLASALEMRPGEFRGIDAQGRAIPKKVLDRKSDAEFEGELLEAGVAAQAAQMQPVMMTAPRNPVLLQEAVKGSADPNKTITDASQSDVVATLSEKGKGLLQAQSTSHRSAELAAVVDGSPMSQKTVASLNTAAAVAGLKPWTKDWVFEGMKEAPTAPIKPLFGGDQPDPTQPAGLAGALERILTQSTQRAEEANGPVQSPAAVEGQGLGMMRGIAGIPSQGSSPELVNAAEISGLGTLQAKIDAPVAAKTATGGAGALSGGEFLMTLNSVKGAEQEKKRSGGEQSMNGETGMRPDLRVIEGGGREKAKKADFSEALEGRAGMEALSRHPMNLQSGGNAGGITAKEVTGHVTSGAMTANRLSTQSLMAVSSGIKDLKAQGGGEIRIRLKPENLGELHLKVVTQGNHVGLQIQASDEGARKILEESITHLKDSMAAQSLTLGKVDFSVAASSQAFGGDLRHDQNQGQNPNQQVLNDMLGQNAGQGSREMFQGGSQSWDGLDRDTNQGRGLTGVRRAAAASGASAVQKARTANANGRLDVMA